MTYLDIPAPSEAALSAAIARFSAELGAAHVAVAGDRLEASLDPNSFDGQGSGAHCPSAVVSPGSVEEVRAVLRIANETRVPLWVVSAGRNCGYGGAAPRVSGSVTVELSRMNRILDVDEDQGYVLVEPGVRFFDLYRNIRESGARLWVSVPGLGWGSVVGNALERGFGYTAYGDHSRNICGLEVVLPDGQVMRTGMGAVPGASTWQLYQPGFGPSLDGLFQQSNLGVVTKMGLWMMPTPEVFVSVEAKVKAEDTLHALVEAIRPLKISGIIPGTMTIRSPLHIASKLSRRSDWWTGEGAIPDEVVNDRIIPEYGLAWWNVNFGLYGEEGIVEAQLAHVRQVLGTVPDTTISVRRYRGEEVGEETIDPTDMHRGGVPNLVPLSILKWRGENGGTLAFAPVSPITGADATAQFHMARRFARDYGFDYYGSFNVFGRHMTHVLQLLFDRDNEADMAKLREMVPLIIREAARMGYSEYRSHLGYMDDIGDVFSFNDNALRHVTERLKDALDPNGILSPGKQGIWPSGMRDFVRTDRL
jgi:4-cresol dehydrogenase (hydroxylating)